MDRYKVENKEAGYRALAYDNGERIAVAFSSDHEPTLTVLNFFEDVEEAVFILDKFCELKSNVQLRKEVKRQSRKNKVKETSNENLV
jgi:hypothetical protein